MKGPLDSKGQSYLLHAIELQHYKRRMKYMLAAAQSHQAEVQVHFPFRFMGFIPL